MGGILLLDIETSPIKCFVWDLFSKNPINPDGVIQDCYILCAAWKWTGKSRVYAVTADVKAKVPDARVVKTLIGVLEQADAVVAHNGERFDLARIRTQAAIQGLVVPPVTVIDTYRIARSKHDFTAARLAYLGKVFGLGQKGHVELADWIKAMDGDAKAMRKVGPLQQAGRGVA